MASKDQKKYKKESILDLSKHVDTSLSLQFQGGRQATGILKGYDQLMNLVMDDVVEVLPDSKRRLGLVVFRGPSITVLNPTQGHEQISNPFV
ncbi:hypothetical protein E3P92_02944 [Wallemia ichthyophaga]|uniref:Sm domain-containing protein n=2 Tax=Wallemia ichthyophaga TaxID=245174 RepID=A0A4T0G3W5_WALIC|nr:U6 snRNA-associated Sm-like protein LSm7 [Wallemia ichthyophaga EXF-994]TIA70814.1 hypothetical protein E3P91_02899 [Wallemia ichthyophaga]EOR00257.1 U6 snRNA-associated Sm-like protein LSm7 [Wallemia ichthyophaga EXF-994]TIA80270.1 hypothetical protein E3P98_02793 [Wallemia ichthyophaga]TIA89044.1 hypothetical protein E3P97_03228 [Wallemia ichthyophaga]TIA95998.1 hypothetical protein E3P96_03712 [Wallemia ichthyophaga]